MLGSVAVPIAILLALGAIWAAWRASVFLRRGDNRRAHREGMSFVVALGASVVAYLMRG